MSRYRFVVAYDGTAYAGWQMQPGQPTIQQVLQDVLCGMVGEPIKVHGSGRTDAGVHALGQVMHADLGKHLPPIAYLRGLNAQLPQDIRIRSVDQVADDFHARKSAVAKEYRYHIYQGEIMPPHLRLYRAHVRTQLDCDAMREALSYLQGQHDFAAFTANPNREVDTTVRTIFEALLHVDGPEIVMILRGDGFLYKMVRSIAGWVIRVGRGEVTAADTQAVLDSRLRTATVPTAPPQGLFLWQVEYGETLESSEDVIEGFTEGLTSRGCA